MFNVQVCVKECPTTNFLLDTYKGSDFKNVMICKDENINKGLKDYSSALAASKSDCARYYLESKEGKDNVVLI